MKDNRLLPFWLPLVVMGVVALVLSSLGMVLYNIAVATVHTIPGVHSGVVIIVALVISLIIAGGAAVYAGGIGGTSQPRR